MRRSDQPSRPSASTDCFLSSPKTLLIPAVNHVSHRLVNVSAANRGGRFSGVPQWPVLGVPRGVWMAIAVLVAFVVVGMVGLIRHWRTPTGAPGSCAFGQL